MIKRVFYKFVVKPFSPSTIKKNISCIDLEAVAAVVINITFVFSVIMIPQLLLYKIFESATPGYWFHFTTFLISYFVIMYWVYSLIEDT